MIWNGICGIWKQSVLVGLIFMFVICGQCGWFISCSGCICDIVIGRIMWVNVVWLLLYMVMVVFWQVRNVSVCGVLVNVFVVQLGG